MCAPAQAPTTASAQNAGMTLSEFIIRNMELILGEWEKFARTIPAAEGMDTKALRDHAEKMLKAFAHDLLQYQSAAQQAAKSKGRAPEPLCKDETAATSHGTDRFVVGFDLKALVSEYRALRATVTRLWTPEVCSEDRETQLSRFNEAIDQALHESVLRYSDEFNRARELFLGVVGHDLRTPLGAILNSAHYLLQANELSAEQIKATAAIQRSGMRIEKMLSDLLDVTRTRLGGTLPIEPKPMDLSRTVKHVTEEAHAFHPTRRVVFTATGDCHGTWDEPRLHQLLSNLVENAIRHGATKKPVKVEAVGKADEVQIAVHNDGDPILQSEMRRIFEPMKQAEDGPKRAEGLGLGLYIARAIATAHHGAIDVESTKKRGTTFTVRLPHHPRAVAERRRVQTGRRLSDGQLPA
jgi:signal transduction histidine kinase